MFRRFRRRQRVAVSIPEVPTGSAVLDSLDTLLSVLVILELFDD